MKFFDPRTPTCVAGPLLPLLDLFWIAWSSIATVLESSQPGCCFQTRSMRIGCSEEPQAQAVRCSYEPEKVR